VYILETKPSLPFTATCVGGKKEIHGKRGGGWAGVRKKICHKAGKHHFNGEKAVLGLNTMYEVFLLICSS
jgi:hypothetical protein